MQSESFVTSFFVQSIIMSGEGETAPNDEFDALPLFVQRVTKKPPAAAQAAKTAENGASSSSSKESKESVIRVKSIVSIFSVEMFQIAQGTK